jgi:hypothetical protein
MTTPNSLSLSIAACLLPACASASGSFAPLGPDHPANAQATEVPIQDPSAFLRAEEGAAPPGMEPAPAAESGEAATGAYVCPMHPKISSNEAGRCLECGMKLVPREKNEEHPHGR